MKRFAKFFVIGTCAFVVDSVVLMLVIKILGLDPYSARLFSFICAASFSWAGNRLFTFRDRANTDMGMEWFKFLTVSTLGFVLNYGTYAFLVATVPLVHEYPVLGVAAGSLAGMILNFSGAWALVFPKA
ncbi:MAG: GtrA family protein [Proteobacteria bacterium]|nr:GtrA family protein [Pseudomonadota bacterium]